MIGDAGGNCPHDRRLIGRLPLNKRRHGRFSQRDEDATMAAWFVEHLEGGSVVAVNATESTEPFFP